MTLSDFIKSKGDEAAAELFEVPVRTVMSWRLQDRRPRPSTAHRIVEKTAGAVTLDGIYPEQVA
jgi:hypothetical protein